MLLKVLALVFCFFGFIGLSTAQSCPSFQTSSSCPLVCNFTGLPPPQNTSFASDTFLLSQILVQAPGLFFATCANRTISCGDPVVFTNVCGQFFTGFGNRIIGQTPILNCTDECNNPYQAVITEYLDSCNTGHSEDRAFTATFIGTTVNCTCPAANFMTGTIYEVIPTPTTCTIDQCALVPPPASCNPCQEMCNNHATRCVEDDEEEEDDNDDDGDHDDHDDHDHHRNKLKCVCQPGFFGAHCEHQCPPLNDSHWKARKGLRRWKWTDTRREGDDSEHDSPQLIQERCEPNEERNGFRGRDDD